MTAEPLGSPAGGFAGPYDRAVQRRHGSLTLRGFDGELLGTLDVSRFCAAADATDLDALARTRGTVLDLGCGPGRLVEAALRAGRPALGVDTSRTAVAAARAGGLPVLRRDVFGPLPDGWDTVLLLDGNLGIGGRPADLLGRCRELLAPGGRVLVECSPDPTVDRSLDVLLEDDGGRSTLFPWAVVGAPALSRHARDAGLRVVRSWNGAGRSFALLSPGSRPDRGR
ncbi:class I SAM-dependent methyltransferase [Kineococcus sp. NBC_00420]|uniref:class I SAM-dependent methyltransferase n=1 Tax=Kineococcus sp. NBC_00420 TaxID=2903564 RepID=UPI002E1DFFE2